MENYPTFIHFMKRYFPTFIATIFVAKISCLLALFALLDSFFVRATLSSQAKISAVCIAICTLVLVHSNFMVVRGRAGWVWVFAGLFVVCLLLCLADYWLSPESIRLCGGSVFSIARAATAQQQTSPRNAQQAGRSPPPTRTLHPGRQSLPLTALSRFATAAATFMCLALHPNASIARF
ncbi:hypothetical protein PSH91_02865 [Pseudomonas sp. FP1154]|uniref:hypothetical protein n=1 Tax=Pseudomonas sp. FP1154 TaxID=2954077 RepID=UPI0027326C50|nr:hypothetical protein [Pseudomonas sp. FP1154]WLG23746.1 hypothetical protein PSH91_02865 [Pseudomonas sp. FP1154]